MICDFDVLLSSHTHEVIDLSASRCMAGLKHGLLRMSVGQQCKLWLPRRLTAPQRQDTDILIDVTLLSIIRSDVFKATTYRNDIIVKHDKRRRHRANTVSQPHESHQHRIVISTPDEPSSVQETETEYQYALPDLSAFGGHIQHQGTDLAGDMHLLVSQMEMDDRSLAMNLSTPRSALSEEDGDTDTVDGRSEYAESAATHSDASNLIRIAGLQSVWRAEYGRLAAAEQVEQCQTACASMAACDCTKRLLMVLKVFQ